MKHQYFGDINDYRKFGLLRRLQRSTGLRLGVWWMLTPADGRSDGRHTKYLRDSKRWRAIDPELFDALATSILRGRDLERVRETGILGSARLLDEVLPDGRDARSFQFERTRELLRGVDLVFADADNGVEVPSRPMGRKFSSKYIAWPEIQQLYSGGHSLLIYQHFRREEGDAFVRRVGNEFYTRIGAAKVVCFRTPNVAFFLLAQDAHTNLITAGRAAAEAWRNEIQFVSIDRQGSV